MHRKTIAVDFDGTITVACAWPEIGVPNWAVIQKAIDEKKSGAALILWTNREGKYLEDAIKACAEWGLTFDVVNDSTEEWKGFFGNNPRKVGADEYWDDRAVALKPYGYWEEYGRPFPPCNDLEQAWRCSVCGFDDGFPAYKYCPECGSIMKEG